MIKRTYSISSANSNTIGALSDTEVLFVGITEGKRVLRSILVPPDISEPSELFECLWQAGLASIWVMPGTRVSRIATCGWFEQGSQHWVAVTHSAPHEPNRPICALLWPKGSGQWESQRLTLVFPEYAGWDWELSDTRSLLATVTYLDQVLARPIIDSPALVAHQLLADLTHDHALLRLHSSPVDVHTLPRQDGSTIPLTEPAQDLAWMRPLTLAEQRQRYLHKYTHFSWHLEACMAVQLGEGAPAYSPNGRAYNGIHPGIWRVLAERAGSVFDGKRLPSGIESEWMSTPHVKCCQDIGYQISVREGYSWSQAQDFLKPWAKTLWEAAERLCMHPQNYRHAQGRANALWTIKHLAQLGMTIITTDEKSGGWHRPDWWAQIVGRSRALFFAHLASLVRKGTMPVLVDRDAIWVVPDDPHPLTAIPGLGTARKWKGYRVGYEVPLPLSREVKVALRTLEHPGQVALALDTLAGEFL